MGFLKRIREHFDKHDMDYVLGLVLLGISGFTFNSIKYQREIDNLRNTARISSENDFTGKRLYGFEDTGDGRIDRIEFRGYTAGFDFTPIPTSRTYRIGDKDFDAELEILLRKGKKR